VKGIVGVEEGDGVMMSCVAWEHGNRVIGVMGSLGHDVMIYVV
jgi:hypothetical protein